MRSRGVILLLFAVALMIQQLPLEPVLWGKAPACCALAQYCPMSARPQVSTGSSCAMKSAPACSIRATCPTGRHESDGAISANAQIRPAVLHESSWEQALVLEQSLVPVASALTSLPGKSPPIPPPRSLFA